MLEYKPSDEEKGFLTALLQSQKIFQDPEAQADFERMVAEDWPALLHALPRLRRPAHALGWIGAMTGDESSLKGLVKLRELDPETLARILPRLERRVQVHIEEQEEEANAGRHD